MAGIADHDTDNDHYNWETIGQGVYTILAQIAKVEVGDDQTTASPV